MFPGHLLIEIVVDIVNHLLNYMTMYSIDGQMSYWSYFDQPSISCIVVGAPKLYICSSYALRFATNGRYILVHVFVKCSLTRCETFKGKLEKGRYIYNNIEFIHQNDSFIDYRFDVLYIILIFYTFLVNYGKMLYI